MTLCYNVKTGLDFNSILSTFFFEASVVGYNINMSLVFFLDF